MRYLRGKNLARSYLDGKVGFLAWEFNTDADRAVEDGGNFYCGRRGAVWFDMQSASTFRARRPDARTVKVTLPLDRLRLDTRSLTTYALSRVHGLYGRQVLVDEEDFTPVLSP